MCRLCSNDEEERKAAREDYEHAAEQLRRLARYYENLAHGRLKPHDDKLIATARRDARFIAKRMLNEWL